MCGFYSLLPKTGTRSSQYLQTFLRFFYYFQNNFLVNFEPTSSSLSSSFFSLLDVQPTTSHILSAARSSKFWLCSWPNSHVHFDEGRGEEIIIIIYFFCYFSSRFFFVEGRKKEKQEGKRCWVVLCLLINAAGPCFAGRAVIPSCEVMAAALKDGPPSNWQSSYKPQMQD